MYSKIANPKTGRMVSINSKLGQEILRNYLNVLEGGACEGVPRQHYDACMRTAARKATPPPKPVEDTRTAGEKKADDDAAAEASALRTRINNLARKQCNGANRQYYDACMKAAAEGFSDKAQKQLDEEKKAAQTFKDTYLAMEKEDLIEILVVNNNKIADLEKKVVEEEEEKVKAVAGAKQFCSYNAKMELNMATKLLNKENTDLKSSVAYTKRELQETKQKVTETEQRLTETEKNLTETGKKLEKALCQVNKLKTAKGQVGWNALKKINC